MGTVIKDLMGVWRTARSALNGEARRQRQAQEQSEIRFRVETEGRKFFNELTHEGREIYTALWSRSDTDLKVKENASDIYDELIKRAKAIHAMRTDKNLEFKDYTNIEGLVNQGTDIWFMSRYGISANLEGERMMSEYTHISLIAKTIGFARKTEKLINKAEGMDDLKAKIVQMADYARSVDATLPFEVIKQDALNATIAHDGISEVA